MEGNRTESAPYFLLISQSVRPLKEMQGFQKSHRTPTNRKDGLRFLTELSASEIEADVDQTFSALKNSFGFKRREISTSVGDLCGIINTPFFRYRVAMDFHGDDLGKIVWRRVVDEISEPSQIANPLFLEVFGKQFNRLEVTTSRQFPLEEIIDRLEDLESELIKLNYDKDLTWCEIGVSPGKVPIRLSGNRMQISSPLRDVTPSELLESLTDIQKHVLELLDIGLPKLDC